MTKSLHPSTDPRSGKLLACEIALLYSLPLASDLSEDFRNVPLYVSTYPPYSMDVARGAGAGPAKSKDRRMPNNKNAVWHVPVQIPPRHACYK